jgi:transcription termination factor Rho
MRKQELTFAILKQLASMDVEIIGEGVVEILQDGFASRATGSLRTLTGGMPAAGLKEMRNRRGEVLR